MLLSIIKNKTALFTLLLFIAGAGILATFLLRNYRDVMMEQRKEETRLHVVNGYELLLYYAQKAKRGDLTVKQAQDYAMEAVRSMSPHNEKYYWINDIHSKMLMHAATPDLEGVELHDYKGPDGQLFFQELERPALSKGGGFIYYLWGKPGSKDPKALYPKVSYVKYYKPWGWIIGSGVYIDDINDSFWSAIYFICGIVLAVLVFLWALGITVTESLKK